MSDGTSAKLLVTVEGNTAFVKISGRANFTSSIDFRTFVNELHLAGSRLFVLDLSECLLMDSTFLGVLAGFALKMNVSNGDCAGRIELHNPSTRIADILENLGVLPLFHVTKGAPLPMDLNSASVAESIKSTREEVTRTCLEAHKLLMEVHPENVARFKDVAKFLAEDLKKIKSGA
jgi:anti-anti-sigma regulatory factor